MHPNFSTQTLCCRNEIPDMIFPKVFVIGMVGALPLRWTKHSDEIFQRHSSPMVTLKNFFDGKEYIKIIPLLMAY